MALSAGRPMRMAAPERPAPRKNVRRDSAVFTGTLAPSSQERLGIYDCNYKLLKIKLRIAECLEDGIDHGLVGIGFRTSGRVTEELFDNALLAGRVGGENLPQGARPFKRRIGNTKHEGRRIERQAVLGRLRLQAMPGFVEGG